MGLTLWKFKKYWHLKLLNMSSLTENIVLIIFWTAWVNYSLLHHHTLEELSCTVSKDYTLLKNGWKPFFSSLQLSHEWKGKVNFPGTFYLFRASKISQENMLEKQGKMLGMRDSATVQWKASYEKN